MNERPCPACGETLHRWAEVAGYEILKCGGCGCGRTRLPEGFDPAAIYSEGYFQGAAADGYADYEGSRAALRAEFRTTVQHLLRSVRRRGSLLEFGCAYGYFLEEAAPFFQSVQGRELSADAVRRARARGLDVTEGIVDGSIGGPFDAVVGLDVIEHVPDPDGTIRHLSQSMAAGGVMILTTGDWASPLARLTGSRWRLMTPPQHLSFFTPRSMRALLERAGLVIEEISHPWKLVPLSLITYQLQRLAGLSPRVWTVPGAVPVNLFDAMRITARKPE